MFNRTCAILIKAFRRCNCWAWQIKGNTALLCLVERVATPPNGTNNIRTVVFVEGLTKAPNMDIDGALLNINIPSPDPVQ